MRPLIGPRSTRHATRVALLLAICAAPLHGCGGDSPSAPPVPVPPECGKSPSARADLDAPESMVSDWGPPVRLGAPINTPCPQDAIEISRDGSRLYCMFTTDLLDSLSPGEILALPNGTFVARRVGGPGSFETPVYYDLGKGIEASFDGEPSFTPTAGRPTSTRCAPPTPATSSNPRWTTRWTSTSPTS